MQLLTARNAASSVIVTPWLRQALNSLNSKMVKRVYRAMVEWEDNPAVEVVVLDGAEDTAAGGLPFCSGSDLALLYQRAQDPRTRKQALEYFRGLYRLQHLIKTYTKPVVANMNGETAGAGLGLALAASSRFSSDTTTIALPQVSQGFIPDGGLSYYLPRLPGGVGMYLALTGLPLTGEAVYWAGLSTHHSAAGLVNLQLIDTLGRFTQSDLVRQPMELNPTYQRNLAKLREVRGVEALNYLREELDIHQDELSEYIKLKSWWRHAINGDWPEASEALKDRSRPSTEAVGRLFDIHAGPEVEDFNEPAEPPLLNRKKRIEWALATLFYLEANEPADDVKELLEGIERCFAGDPDRGDPVLPVLRDEISSAAEPEVVDIGPLPTDWVERVHAVSRARGGTRMFGAEALREIVDLAIVGAGGSPDESVSEKMEAAVRAGVAELWGTGGVPVDVCKRLQEVHELPDGEEFASAIAEAVLETVSSVSGQAIEALLDDAGRAAQAERKLAADEAWRKRRILMGDIELVRNSDDPDDDAGGDFVDIEDTTLLPQRIEPSANAGDMSEEQMEALRAWGASEEARIKQVREDDITPLLDDFEPPEGYADEALATEDSLLKSFGMPRTKRLRQVAATARESVLKERRDEQWAVPQVATVEEVVDRLEGERAPWASEALDAICAAPPLSLKLTHRLLVDGSTRTFEQCVAAENRAALRALDAHDIGEAARAGAGGSAGTAAWLPSALEDVSAQDVDAMLADVPSDEDLRLPVAARSEAWAPIEAEMDQWYKALELHYESGEAKGLGAELNGRFLWLGPEASS